MHNMISNNVIICPREDGCRWGNIEWQGHPPKVCIMNRESLLDGTLSKMTNDQFLEPG